MWWIGSCKNCNNKNSPFDFQFSGRRLFNTCAYLYMSVPFWTHVLVTQLMNSCGSHYWEKIHTLSHQKYIIQRNGNINKLLMLFRYCRNIRYLVPINIQIVQQTKTIFSHIMQSNKMDDNSTHIIHAHRPMLIVTQRPN